MIEHSQSELARLGTEAADLLVDRELETRFGRWREYYFRYAEEGVVVLTRGDIGVGEPPLTRVHSTCFSAHYLWSIECDCREQLDLAFEIISKEGRGLLVFLDQDGRANGHAATMRAAVYAREHGCNQGEAYQALGYPGDGRSFRGASVVLRKLHVRSVRLITNNPDKCRFLEEAGIEVQQVGAVMPASRTPWLKEYYQLKAQEGHSLNLREESSELRHNRE